MKPLLGLCALALLTGGVYRIVACGPFFPKAIFVYQKHPDIPRNQFLNGRLGVLQPTYARSYLVIAYRYLNGTGLNAGERDQVRLYWNDRQSGWWEKDEADWYGAWQSARAKALGEPEQAPARGKPSRYDSDTHSWRQNCSDDAFRNATVTLKDRQKRWGRNSGLVKEWIEAQDVVFGHCTEASEDLPPPADDDAPPLMKADRKYQVAAALFYSGKYERAAAEFRAIAADASSPWKGIAPYLVVRTLAKEAQSLQQPQAQPFFDQAFQQVDAIMADRSLTPIHGMTQFLVRRIRMEVQPQEEVRELARTVVKRNSEGSLREDLWDYRRVLDHFLDFPEFGEPSPEFKKERATLPRQDDITDWIVTFQSADRKEASHAMRRWQQTRSLPWLVNAIAHATGLTPEASELIAASESVPKESPAFWHVAYHRNRLRIEAGDKLGAREELDSLDPDAAPGVSKSALNLFRALRMQTAPDLAAFLRFGLRTPVMVTDDSNYGEAPGQDELPAAARQGKEALWDRDSIKVLNERAPMRIWAEAASNKEMPSYLRQELVLSAFARAIVLGDDAAAQQLASQVREVFPQGGKYIHRYRAETTAEGRRFAGMFLMEHYANIRPYLTSGVQGGAPSRWIDSYSNSWWCSFDSPYELDWDTKFGNGEYSGKGPKIDPDVAASRVAFLTSDDLAAGKAEWKRLASMGTAPDFFWTLATQRAKEKPDDPRIPEALHYVVSASYYGCNDAKTPEVSKDAFTRLHKQYPKNIWTERTPYWYDKYYPPGK